MSINNVLLFVSSTSQSSLPPIKFIREHDLPVLIVRLDTYEDRMKASTGPYFKVTEVPTMVISYTDGTMQLFVGSEKILGWMSNIVNAKKENVKKSSETIEIYEEEEEEEKPKNKKKKKKIVTFDEDTELLGKSSVSKKSSASSKKLTGNKPPSKNSEVFSMAKKMEDERSSSLGYKEEELAKY